MAVSVVVILQSELLLLFISLLLLLFSKKIKLNGLQRGIAGLQKLPADPGKVRERSWLFWEERLRDVIRVLVLFGFFQDGGLGVISVACWASP